MFDYSDVLSFLIQCFYVGNKYWFSFQVENSNNFPKCQYPVIPSVAWCIVCEGQMNGQINKSIHCCPVVTKYYPEINIIMMLLNINKSLLHSLWSTNIITINKRHQFPLVFTLHFISCATDFNVDYYTAQSTAAGNPQCDSRVIVRAAQSQWLTWSE